MREIHTAEVLYTTENSRLDFESFASLEEIIEPNYMCAGHLHMHA